MVSELNVLVAHSSDHFEMSTRHCVCVQRQRQPNIGTRPWWWENDTSVREGETRENTLYIIELMNIRRKKNLKYIYRVNWIYRRLRITSEEKKKRVLSSNSFNIIKKLRVATSFDIIVVLVALTLTLDIDSISTSRTEENFQHFFYSLFFAKCELSSTWNFDSMGDMKQEFFFFSLL